MRSADGRASRAERILAIAAVPALATLDLKALTALSERVEASQVAARVPLTARPGRIRILPVDPTVVRPGGAATSSALAPELVAWLAGEETWSRELVPARAGLALALEVDALHAVLQTDSAASLAVVRALALEIAVALREPRVAAELVAAMTYDLGVVPARLELADRLLLLRAALPFARRHVASLFQLARHSTELHADHGYDLWRPGDPSDSAFLVLRGQVATTHGEEAVAGAGCLLGIFDALIDQPRSSRASVRGSLVALTLPMECMLDILEDEPQVMAGLRAAVARALLLVDHLDAR